MGEVMRMKKEIRKIRRSIQSRKKTITPTFDQQEKQFISNFPTDEERFGFFPELYESSDHPFQLERRGKKVPVSLIVKLASALLLFLTSYVLFQQQDDLFDQPKQWVTHSLTKEFPFASVHQWYVTTVGESVDFSFLNGQSSSPIIREDSLPVSGEVVESFALNGTGIRMSTENKTDVTAVDAGIVIFAGNDPHTKKTIIIQHADRSITTYGFLEAVNVHLYEAVEANEKIGSFQPTDDNATFFFAFEKENEFIDPLKVIPVDDFP